MRARMTLVVLAIAAVPTLAAQRAHQFEIGAFGSFTRYDRAFNLDKQIGGGGRLGYFFGQVVGLEVAVGYQSPSAATGSATATLTDFSSSLMLNFGGERNIFYILGGYSHLDFEKAPPYRFSDHAVHGALGDRIFLGDQVALRLEVRGIYAPNTGFVGGGDWAGHIVGSLGLSIFSSGGYRDLDKDGVRDNRDTCPGTPTGAVVDPQGCPIDSDRDKVYDGLDACPNTVDGAQVDARGCPTDADADGVFDGIDQCAGTPTGARVDAAGCPILFTEARTPVILRGVTFEVGKSALRPESFTVLDIVAASLVANPDIRIEIAGHTDSTGSAATNTRLSQSRADAVRAYLAQKGVGPDRMIAKGYGPSVPIAPNTTAAGRAQNR